MEDSRKGKRDGEKELSTPNPHVDGGKCKKVIVYNTKEEKKKGRKKEEKTKRGVYSQVIVLGHVRGYFRYQHMRITLPF